MEIRCKPWSREHWEQGCGFIVTRELLQHFRAHHFAISSVQIDCTSVSVMTTPFVIISMCPCPNMGFDDGKSLWKKFMMDWRWLSITFQSIDVLVMYCWVQSGTGWDSLLQHWRMKPAVTSNHLTWCGSRNHNEEPSVHFWMLCGKCLNAISRLKKVTIIVHHPTCQTSEPKVRKFTFQLVCLSLFMYFLVSPWFINHEWWMMPLRIGNHTFQVFLAGTGSS